MATLTPDQIRVVAQRHFGDLGPQVVEAMTRIAIRESGGRTDAFNGQGTDRSRGLWQINTHPRANPQFAGWNLEDPDVNARAARLILEQQGLRAWTTAPAVLREMGMPTGPRPSGQRGGTLTDTLLDRLTPLARGVDGGPVQSAIRSSGSGNIFADLRAAQEGALLGLLDQFLTGQIDAEEYLALAESGIRSLGMLTDFEREGRAQLGDGSYVTLEDLEHPDPAVRAQARAALFRFGQEALGNGNSFLRMAGLPEIDPALLRDPEEAARQAQQEFEDRLARLSSLLAVDQADLARASAEVERSLSGLAESRARASEVASRLIQAAPLATSGRTQFSGGDFGGGVSLLLRQAGVAEPERYPLIQYPTTVHVDPEALMRRSDEALGVAGSLPATGGPLVGTGEVPLVPDLVLDDEFAGAPPAARAILAAAGREPPPSRISGLTDEAL